MKLILLHLRAKDRPLEEDGCLLCMEDDTIENPFKAPPYKMQRHQKTKVHTKRDYFKRKYAYFERQNSDRKLACPWGCNNLFYEYVPFQACTNSTSFKCLIGHRQRTTSQTDEHLIAVGADGLFDDDWETGMPNFLTAAAPKMEASRPLKRKYEYNKQTHRKRSKLSLGKAEDVDKLMPKVEKLYSS
jgi:hypothetical protein